MSYPPQQYWPAPRKRRNGWMWALGAAVVIAVVATVLVVVKGDDAPASDESFGVASADDTAPAGVITDDPSCAAWIPVQTTLSKSLTDEWRNRDLSIPANTWSPKQRGQYEAAATVFEEAAERTVPLAKLTPHRVVRELYEQFIAYSRAFADALPDYKPVDNNRVAAATMSSEALGYVCSAITYDSAQARGPFLPTLEAPERRAPVSDPAGAEPLMEAQDAACDEWDELLSDFNEDTRDYQTLDTSKAATERTREERRIVDAAIPVMREYADKIEELRRRSEDPRIEDLATLAAQYRRAYADALPTYMTADSYLPRASQRTTSVIYYACKAAAK
ncbi:Uncharacterised protein [Mycolicibacterium phlei]|uniref:Uncharacterized protein n=2 Tax=Mycolicibacterium phlei TaxID=1771 RepID=A0A5N5VCE4_MYCPH|nr:hypothetical protein [Mycolicibacterium phlei]VEG11807.1 Uncharacterised protein [Mycobacteroides chelonae]AMO63714.1 hypothetical protein MPHLCCUG_04929 [Mycolicibacterium phlei]EID16480.1 hypothetical protein MPHLEI_05752 [Mycolicibacterium phlei RIVM601174]KAB7759458.1 hypothetical protein MPHL21000_00020 [Mycolicibacterium phlei DSM 43239 = CCUG 21000]KXW68500.1 hypothetical protein MPHL43239_00060 [Mycolicibacterium phlei DSM 43239 = CCUG 21000]